jgi:hypothetical protein
MNAEPTKVRLARALREAGLDALATAAEQGRYDDFESASATPLLDLVIALRDAGGQTALIARVQNGDFDASDAEAAAWFAGEGQYLIRGFEARYPKDGAP